MFVIGVMTRFISPISTDALRMILKKCFWSCFVQGQIQDPQSGHCGGGTKWGGGGDLHKVDFYGCFSDDFEYFFVMCCPGADPGYNI